MYAIKLGAEWLGVVGMSLFLFAGVATAGEWYVAPTGKAQGDGSKENPWDLQTALSHPAAVKPGDTIWLRGGRYNVRGRVLSSLKGTVEQPIKVCQAKGERAILEMGDSNENVLSVSGAYAWYCDFEVMSSALDRVAPHTSEAHRGMGISVSSSEAGVEPSPGLKFINLVVHDTQGGGGFAFWKGAIDGEIYGCIIYYCGCNAFQHGIYTQNDAGTKRIEDNIIFANAGWGIHAYGSERAYLNNFHIEGNILFDNGIIFKGYNRNIHIGGGRIAENPVVIDNYSYFDPTQSEKGIGAEVGYDKGCKNSLVRGNIFSAERSNAFWLKSDGAEVTGNTFLGKLQGCDPKAFPHNVYCGTTRPKGMQVFVRPNKYEPGRANICVFNWDNLEEASADVSKVLAPGDAYEIRDAQNFFGPAVAAGVYAGKPITLRLNLTAVAPVIGGPTIGPAADKLPLKTAPHTPKEFNAFVLVKTAR